METRIEKPTPKLDARTILVLRDHAEDLDNIINKLRESKHEEKEREEIKKDKNLNEYYQTFIRQWTDSWLACLTIHSNRVSNAESNHWDDASTVLDKASDYASFPGAKLLTDILNTGIQFKSNQKKRNAVNKIANFFNGLREGDEIIEKVARKLTLVQRDELKKMGEATKTRVKKMYKKAQVYLQTDDIDTDTKELAAEHGKKILEGIIENDLPAHTIDINLIAERAVKKEEEKTLSTRAKLAFFQPKLASNDPVIAESQEKPKGCCVIM